MKEVLQKINEKLESVPKLRDNDNYLSDRMVINMLTDISNTIMNRRQDIIDEVLTIQDEYKRAVLIRLLL